MKIPVDLRPVSVPLRILAGILFATSSAGTAAPPLWWNAGNPPVIDSNATEENKGVANIGQAKWMAKNALAALRAILPDTADLVEADLVGAGKPIASWDAPVTPAEQATQRAPLLVGQLKSISAPFYTHLKNAAPAWVSSEMAFYGMPGGDFPWTLAAADDANKAPAVIGQMKAVFSLDFMADREVGSATDGLPDLWEQHYFGNLTQAASGDPDGDGISNLAEYHAGSSPADAWNEPVMAVAAGSSHSLALASDGRVWSWGYNGSGQLGHRGTAEQRTPTPVSRVPGMGKIVAIAAAEQISMALDENGALWGWGDGLDRLILPETTQKQSIPTRISFPSTTGPIVAFSTGGKHVMALDGSGNLWLWGNNSYGQLGLGHTNTVPGGPAMLAKPAAMGDVKQVVASNYSTYVLDSNGVVWAWGRGGSGQLGKGNTSNSSVPAAISAPAGFPAIRSISSKQEHVLALGVDETIWGWGANSYGQLGLGDYNHKNAPVKLMAPSTSWQAVATGHYHSMATSVDGRSFLTGDNGHTYCILGTAAPTLDKSFSFLETSSVTGWSHACTAAGSDNHNIAGTPDGSVWTWGYGGSGRLGHGDTANKGVPTRISILNLGGDDSDLDGLADSWERRYFGNLVQNGSGMTAGGLTLAQAYQNQFDPVSGDSDLDLMPDSWEITHSLDPHDDSDALTDTDGDRVPNLWEFKRGTVPTDPASKPAPDRIVDASNPGTTTDNRYATIAEAVNAAPSNSIDPAWHHVVEVKTGVYNESVALPSSKRITLLGEAGGAVPEIRNPSIDDPAMEISGNSFVDGFRITNSLYRDATIAPWSGQPGINVNYSGVVASISNVIIHNQRTNSGAALRTYGKSLRLSHVTVFDCGGQNNSHSIYLSGGKAEILDSIIWGSDSPSISQIYTLSNAFLTVERSFIRGGEYGASDSDPMLTPQGWLKAGSPAINSGNPAVVSRDIHGETRLGSSDAGADEFRDSDSDGLPDWLEARGVQNVSGDNDGDLLTNLAEYDMGLDPLSPDSDGDQLNDGAELAAGANPLWTDSDLDFMTDGWEVIHGLSPADASDMLEDADGDRVPNVYEFTNASDPTLPGSVPPPHLVVDPSLATETATHKKTISAAIFAAPTISSQPSRFTIIQVKSGTYTQSLSISDRRILLLGKLGASSPVISPTSGTGLTIYEKSVVVDGFHFRKNSGSSTGQGIHVSLDSLQSEARLINCLITDQSNSDGAAIYLGKGRLNVTHCTLANNSASSQGRGVYVNGSDCHLDLVNSIVWNPSGSASEQIYQSSTGTVTSQNNLILGAELGGNPADPKLDRYQSLMPGSPAIGAGAPLLVPVVDIHGELRSSSNPDIGADQYTNSDSDTLPDWWEMIYFGNLAQNGSNDNDPPMGDRLTNYYEYLLGFHPLNPDAWVNGSGDLFNAVFGSILDPWYPAEWRLDPDNDGLSNGQELYYGSDPNNPDTNGDGVNDFLAVFSGLSPISDDTDSDGVLNAIELSNGTSPVVADTDGDGYDDGDDYLPLDPTIWEAPSGSGDSTAPQIQLQKPAGALLQP